jgi:hypothetical protein
VLALMALSILVTREARDMAEREIPCWKPS